MIDIEDQIRFVLRSQADAMHVPDARPGEHVARVIEIRPPRRQARWWMAAAAAALVIGSGIALAQRRAEPPAAANPPTSEPITAAAASSLHFETPTVRMDASSVEVVVGDQTFVPTTDVRVAGDPGMPNEYTTLELTWQHGEVEQRINMYFTSDGTEWWAHEIRTYNGQRNGDWFEPAAQGQYFKSPLGVAYQGDLDLPNLRIRDMTLEAFRRPAACDESTYPVALIADYPVIEAFPGDSFGASFQLVDTQTCTAMAVEPYTFDYTSDDPSVAAIQVPQEDIPDYPPARTRLALQLVNPGTTIIHATAKDEAGNVVGTVDVNVIVRPTDQTAPQDTAPS